eukprot:gene10816-biopygen4808
MPRPRHSSQNVYCLRRRTTLAPLARPSLAALPPLHFRVTAPAAVAAALCAWCATSDTAVRWRVVFGTVWEECADADAQEDPQLQYNWDSVFALLELPPRPPGRRGAGRYVALRPPLAPWRLMCAGKSMGWGCAKGRAPISGRFGGYPPPRAAGPAARTPAGTWAERTPPFNGHNGEREEGVYLSSPVRTIAPPCPQPHPTKQHLNYTQSQHEMPLSLLAHQRANQKPPCPEMLGVAAAAPAAKRRRPNLIINVRARQMPPRGNSSGRGPDAGRTIDMKETGADRTRAWQSLPVLARDAPEPFFLGQMLSTTDIILYSLCQTG